MNKFPGQRLLYDLDGQALRHQIERHPFLFEYLPNGSHNPYEPFPNDHEIDHHAFVILDHQARFTRRESDAGRGLPYGKFRTGLWLP